MSRIAKVLFLCFVLSAAVTGSACQSPSETETSIDVDDFVDAEGWPDPATAESSSGKTYRVVRGNNQPDDILAYDWKVSFAVNVRINSNATTDDVDLDFPVEITSATVKVQQASGGIVTPPTGGDTEHYESVITSSTTNKISAVNGVATLYFDVWYDLPNLKKEALATITVTFKDDDGSSFTKDVTLKIT